MSNAHKQAMCDKWSDLIRDGSIKLKKPKPWCQPPGPSRRDTGMLGYMKSIGYNIVGVPVPRGFADWSLESRASYILNWSSDSW